MPSSPLPKIEFPSTALPVPVAIETPQCRLSAIRLLSAGLVPPTQVVVGPLDPDSGAVGQRGGAGQVGADDVAGDDVAAVAQVDTVFHVARDQVRLGGVGHAVGIGADAIAGPSEQKHAHAAIGQSGIAVGTGAQAVAGDHVVVGELAGLARLEQDAGGVLSGDDVAFVGVVDSVAVGADHVAAAAEDDHAIAPLRCKGIHRIARQVCAQVIALDHVSTGTRDHDVAVGIADKAIDGQPTHGRAPGHDVQAVGETGQTSIELDDGCAGVAGLRLGVQNYWIGDGRQLRKGLNGV